MINLRQPPASNDPKPKRNWESFKKNVTWATRTGRDSSVKARSFLDLVDRWFRRLDGFTLKHIPADYHPFIQAGAIANLMFVIAVITGFALLIWYSPSVHSGYDSVLNMANRPFTAQLVRSLHRYSSDAFMLMTIFHAFKVFFAGRFTQSRWLAWITGIIAILIVWFDGWTGYWLVWDDRATMVATGTAKMLDVLPFFAEPLRASFLTDDSFNSVLFLLVFFVHMLIPIAFGVAIWLHVSRLNKPGFITNKKYSILLLVVLVAVSLIFPADIGERADLLKNPSATSIDYFYLLPLVLTERLEGGALWLIFLVGFTVTMAVPWLFRRKQQETKPVVDDNKCNGCTQCFLDCPYNAISMLPREDGDTKKSEFVALIDPAVCVACGICVGSCDPVAIEYPTLSPWDIRNRLDRWLGEQEDGMEGQFVAFVCGNSAGSYLNIDPETGKCPEMPGYMVLTTPCAGWVHPSLIERALKKNAAGVLVAGCQSDPDFRLGADWLGHRIEGQRHPEYRKDKYESDRLMYIKMDKPEFDRFLDEAQQFRRRLNKDTNESLKNRSFKLIAAGVLLTALFTIFVVWPSSTTLPVAEQESQLIVSFKVTGKPVYIEDEQNDQRLDHMQRQDGQQRIDYRSDVALRITSDGSEIYTSSFRPHGLFKRGPSSGLLYIPVTAGAHLFKIEIGDLVEGVEQWHTADSLNVMVGSDQRVVVTFDEGSGFRWYTGN